jgi:diacylglycerol kinase family enzyme
LADRLVRSLKQRGVAYRMLETRKAGFDAPLEAMAGDGCRAIVSVGGDGTFNALLNQLDDPSRIPLAILPTGTANILAKELRLPKTPGAVAKAIEMGPVRRIDMGLVGTRRFCACVSCGFDAMVTRALAQRKGALGYRGYIKPVASVLKAYRPPRLAVTVDGVGPIQCAYALVSNIKNYGGLFQLAHRAGPDSGRLDVCMLTRAGLLQIALLAGAGFAKLTHLLNASQYIYRTGARIRIEAGGGVPVQVDGDYHGTGSVEISITPRCIPVIGGA